MNYLYNFVRLNLFTLIDMGLFKHLFGKSEKDKEQIILDEQIEVKLTPSLHQNTNVIIPESNLEEITNMDINTLILNIQSKIATNRQKEKENDIYYQKQSDKFLKDSFNGKPVTAEMYSFQEIVDTDYLYYYPIYELASNEEKTGNIKRACEILWYNIYNNGTLAIGNYNRLLILLRKLEEYEKELVIANICKNVIPNCDFETIDKRIVTINKKLAIKKI